MPDEADSIVFQIGEHYRNRLGCYTVLAIDGDRIHVRYTDDGRTDTLTIDVQKRIISNLRREEPRPGIIDRDRATFFSYVEECNQSYRFGHDLGLYGKIIAMHRTAPGIDSLLDDTTFFRLVWDTLDAWNMNQRGAQLATLRDMTQSITAHRAIIRRLYACKLPLITQGDIQSAINQPLHDLFCGLHVMASRRRIVGVSKAMHFLLPDLVTPIDGTYTLPYFFGYNRYDSSDEAEYATFHHVFLEAYRITNRLNLTDADVDHENWNTSVPKLIDDAIIGLFKRLDRHVRATLGQ